MRIIKKMSALAVALLLVGGTASAQKSGGKKGKFINSTYDRLEVSERKVIPYPPLREADVMYRKDITRLIDVREKKNKPMNWPKNPLNTVLYSQINPPSLKGEDDAVGKIKVYADDSFNTPLKMKEIAKIGGFCETVDVQNPANPDDPYDVIPTEVCTPFDASQIVRWQLNEQWIFDKQRGMFYPRIVSICPLYNKNVAGIEYVDLPMFYIKYDDIRQKLATEDCFNRANDGQKFTYYDWFESRLFSSYITKVSNADDMAVREQLEFKDNPMEALYESERLKQELIDWEIDLWEY